MKVIDNVNETFSDDLKNELSKGTKISMASASFSIYAYQELKSQLEKVDSMRFIFTSPTFVKEKTSKEKREFYIPRLSRERNVYGTEFELKLRNELTQKAIAKECADWIRRKVEFRSNTTDELMNNFLNVSNDDTGCSYTPVNGFTTVDLGCERGKNLSNFVVKSTFEESTKFLDLFESVWNDRNKMQNVKDQILESITTAYAENSPEFIYFVTLYNIFSTFLENISEDYLPNEGVGFKESKIWDMLYPFQKDATLAIINKMETFNGCILADSVGLGKTFTALGVIKYYESRNKNVLVLCPKRLAENWNTFKDNYKNNPIASDRLRYDVLYHTDLSRKKGKSNGLDLARLNWGNYDLVVIDESHNFRNGGDNARNVETENRYQRLLRQVIRDGVKTKVLMLSATPVNNRFRDLFNQLEIAYEGDPLMMQKNLQVSRSLKDIFSNAQKAFTMWIRSEPEQRTTENLLKMMDFDFFEVLDSVTIARSRRHIEKYYNIDDVGRFPKRLPPISMRPNITNAPGILSYQDINDRLSRLNLAAYIPTDFLLPSKASKYIDADNNVNRAGRELGIRRLMSISLLKRLESSVYSFKKTVDKVLFKINKALKAIDTYDKNGKAVLEYGEDDEPDDEDEEIYAFEQDMEINIADMDYLRWKEYLERDRSILDELSKEVSKITPDKDKKLMVLDDIIRKKMENPINPGNRKVIVFSAFADTVDYIYSNLSAEYKSRGINVGKITGSDDCKSTIKGLGNNFNDILTCFSPISKSRELLYPHMKEDIEILIGTDCISEGQNLQDCDFCINYDIHWNPVRIIQRFGRVDRIGSRNDVIQLVNFWPDVDLDEYINLKDRVETRMKASVMTSTGDDNVIDSEELGDLEYRKHQLEKLQTEVVDIEEMQSGVSILDLGLNEFRLDLLEYIKEHGDLDHTPFGLHGVIPSTPDSPPGVIFILKNINNNVNTDNQNRLHPFYMVYIKNDGTVQCNHLSPKKMLDIMRHSCKGYDKPIKELCDQFNKATNDGKDMRVISELLSSSIDSIIERKEQSDLDSFLTGGDVSFHNTKISGMDDFELICFMVVI